MVEHSLRPNGVEMVIILQGILLYVSHLYYEKKSLIFDRIPFVKAHRQKWQIAETTRKRRIPVYPNARFYPCAGHIYGKLLSILTLL